MENYVPAIPNHKRTFWDVISVIGIIFGEKVWNACGGGRSLISVLIPGEFNMSYLED